MTRPACPTLARVAALALALAAALPALAQDHHGHGAPNWHGGDHWRFDDRYHHDHYYPGPGYFTPVLPGGSISIGFGGIDFFFRGGVWFRGGPRGYVVVAPPIGIVAPVLPPAYVTLWIGGRPYYYADGAYYAIVPGGYQVVAPPPGADSAAPAAPPPPPAPSAPDPIVYPRNGQSAAQTEVDRRECNTWATTQRNAMNDARIFQRAVEACLEGRGYTVR
jgi:hypothetical protein